MLLRTASDTGTLLSFWVFIPPKFFLFQQVVLFQKTNGFQHAGAGLFLPIFLGFQSSFRLKGGRYHGASRLLALQTAAACSTFTSTANLLEDTIYSIKIKSSLQYIASFGDPGGIRTHGLSLRRRPLYPTELRNHILESPYFHEAFEFFGLPDRGEKPVLPR